MPFTWKISAMIAAVVAAIVITANSIVYVTFAKDAYAKENEVMEMQADRLMRTIADVAFLPKLLIPAGNDILKADLSSLSTQLEKGQLLRVVKENGELVDEVSVGFDERWLDTERLDGRKESVQYEKEGMLIHAVQHTVVIPYYGVCKLQLFETDTNFTSQVQFMGRLLVFGTVTVIVVTAAASFLLARLTIRPVVSMTEKVRSIGVHDLRDRVQLPKYKDEIYKLGETFNQLLSRISEGFEQQRRFVADASHELKTPITVVEGHANMVKRCGKGRPEIMEESLEYILQETRRMKLLTEQLLLSAEAEQRIDPSEQGPTELGPVLESLAAQCGHLRPSVTVVCETITLGTKLAMSPLRLHQAVRNIVENALKYTPDGGQVTISASVEPSPGFVEVTVEDTGIGIPDEDIPHLFERFYRVDKSRSREVGGSGLGLSITKTIIDRYGGTIRVVSSVGQGSAFTLALPLSAGIANGL